VNLCQAEAGLGLNLCVPGVVTDLNGLPVVLDGPLGLP
jgi:hypothetical protein